MDRAGDQILNAAALQLCAAVSVVATISFPQENATWLPATLLTVLRQTIVDLVANDEEAEQGSVGSSAAIDGLHESLVEVMISQPPVAGLSAVLIEGLLEIFLGRFAGEAGSLGMQRDDLAAAIDQHEKIAGRRSAKYPATRPEW